MRDTLGRTRAGGALVLLLAGLGCGLPPLTPRQRDALLERIRDQGAVAHMAIVARDQARGREPDAATLAFIDSETASLVSDVAASLRQ